MTTEEREDREDGFGTIEERGGKFRARLPRSLDPDRRSRTFDTLEEAERFIRGGSALLVEQRPIAGDTLAQYGRDWLNRRERNGVRGITQERSVWRNHVEASVFGRAPITTVTRADIRDHFEALQRKRTKSGEVDAKGKPKFSRDVVSHQTMKHVLRLVRGCLADAVEREVIQTNPARDFKLPKAPPRTEDPWTYLEPAEIDIVMGVVAASTKEKLPLCERVIYTVAIFTGLREGELWGLHSKDVHLEGDRPHVVVRFSHRGATKSGKIRRVPLLEPARVALEEWLASKARPRNKQGLVFPTVRGNRRQKSDDAGWSTRKVRGVLRIGWKDRLGITRDVRFHDMRHTCGSHLVMGSWGRAWTLIEVRDFLGHSDVKVTERYAHLAPDHLHAAARATALSASKRGPSVVPAVNSGSSDSDENRCDVEGRAMLDSNQRPLAPEGRGQFNDDASLDPIGTTLGPGIEALARVLLVDLASGRGVPRERLEEISRAVLESRPVVLAQQVLDGGPHAIRKAIELAALVCSVERVEEQSTPGRVAPPVRSR